MPDPASFREGGEVQRSRELLRVSFDQRETKRCENPGNKLIQIKICFKTLRSFRQPPRYNLWCSHPAAVFLEIVILATLFIGLSAFISHFPSSHSSFFLGTETSFKNTVTNTSQAQYSIHPRRLRN